jgi:hypothetical protein
MAETRADMDVAQLADPSPVAAILHLKSRYMECLNQKRWEELAGCLTEDAVASYESGHSLQGRAAIIEYLRDSLGLLNAVHVASNPRVTLQDVSTATGIWDLRYRWHDPWDNTSLRGAGIYSDRYAKVGTAWLISFTGITPV